MNYAQNGKLEKSTTDEPFGIAKEFIQMTQVVSRVGDLLNELAARMQPVLRPEETIARADNAKDPVGSPLGDAIRELTSVASRQADHLIALLSRIDLG